MRSRLCQRHRQRSTSQRVGLAIWQTMSESFPRLHARTRRFTLGAPRGFTIAPGGDRVVFLRSRGGTDPVTCLWDARRRSPATERWSPTPARSTAGRRGPAAPRSGPAASEPRAGRRRSSAYATDAAATRRVRAVRRALRRRPRDGATRGGSTRPAPVDRPAARPPTAAASAYVTGGALHVQDLHDGRRPRRWPRPTSPTVTYGLAEFVAAEEMNRMRGLLVVAGRRRAARRARRRRPGAALAHRRPRQPRPRARGRARYPAAGTPNAGVSSVVIGLDGARAPGAPATTSTWPTSPGTPTALSIVDACPATSATCACCAVDPATGAHHPRPRGHRPTPGWTSSPACPRAPVRRQPASWVADAEGAHAA